MPVKTICYEVLDKTKITELIKSVSIEERERVMLEKLKRKRNTEVKYMLGMDQVSGLRVKRMSAQGTSLVQLSKISRNYLTADKYKELDISNCAMGILNDLCKKEDVISDAESNFIDNLYTNRDALFEKHAEKSKDDHKSTYITFLFGDALGGYTF